MRPINFQLNSRKADASKQSYSAFIFLQPLSFLKNIDFAGGIQSPVAVRGWMVECAGSLHVLQIMWMAHPNQADRPQGTHRVSDGLLVANDLGKAQAGNRAGKTRHDLQWWDTEPE